VTVHPDRALDEYAARQYGVFSLKQVKSLGFTPKMIETRRTNGAWIRLAPSVYALASAPPKWERHMAAALLTREGSIVAGKSAAYLHGFPGARAGRPVIMIDIKGNARSPLAIVLRSTDFDSVGRVRRRGFVTTNETETIVALARDHTVGEMERIVDETIASGTCSVADLDRLLRRRERVPGVKKLRPIIAERGPAAYQPPVSELERLLYDLVEHPDVPAVTRQMPFLFRSVKATVDLYIPAWRLIVEADGRRWHTRKADMELDRRRDNEATAHGLAVLRFTWQMLTKERDECLETLLQTGRVRSVS